MRRTFGALLVLIATWLIPAFSAWGQLNCTSCNTQFLQGELSGLDTSCTAGSALDLLPDFLDYTSDCSDGFSTAVAKFPLGNERVCNGNRPEDLPYFFGTVHLHNFESTGLANSDAFTIDGAGGTWTMHDDNIATFEGRILNRLNASLQFQVELVLELSTSGASWMAQGGNINLAGSDSTEAENWGIWQVKPLMSRMVGLSGLAGQFLLVQNSSVDVSHPFQVGTNAHGFPTNTEGVAGNFGWSTCIGSVVHGGFGQVAVEFDSCVQHEATCASDRDAVGRYVVGNQAGYVEATRTVNLTDQDPPTFTEVPDDLELECPADPYDVVLSALPAAVDDCSSWVLDSIVNVVPGTCAQEVRVLTTYLASDACGNTSEHLHTVEVVDRTAPTLTAPASVEFGCDEPLVYDDAFALDACEGEVPVVELAAQIVDGDCPSNYTVLRTFVSTDGCGNDTTVVQTVQVRDLEPPTFILPDHVFLDCGEPEDYPDIAVEDNCTPTSDLPLDIANFLVDSECEGSRLLQRQAQSTDACGNLGEGFHLVTISDSTPPTFVEVPEDMTLACGSETPLPWPTVEDDCSTWEVEVVADTTWLDCPQNMDVVRTFVATDACGNVAEVSHTVSYRDTTPPQLTLPENDVQIDCDADWVFDGAGLAEDLCSDVVWDVQTQVTAPAEGSVFSLLVTATASDQCGNAATGQFLVNNVDSEAPQFTFVPEDLTLVCEDPIPPSFPEASDACSPVFYASSDTTVAHPDVGVYQVIRRFEVSDVYGNVADSMQTFTVLDYAPPVFTFVPPGDTVYCGVPPALVQAEAVDNCGDVTMVVSEELAAEDALGNETLVRRYEAFDLAGNSTVATQVVQMENYVPPAFGTVPADVSLACDQPWESGLPEVVPGCGPWELSVTEDTLEGSCGNLLTLVRTFDLTDETGLVDQAIQTQTQVDITPPTLNAVAFWPLNCGDDMDLLPQPVVLDDCNGETTLTWSDEVSVQGCATPASEVIRTYTATDACGNQSSASTAAVFLDLIPPVWTTLPQDTTVNCEVSMDVVYPTALDNCSAVEVAWFADTLGLPTTGTYTVLNTFLASDACGNTTTHTQVVTHVDATPPSWTFIPADLNVQCGEAIPMVLPQATDNCSDNVVVEWLSDEWTPGACGGTGTWARTFQAFDIAGNDTLVVQHIAVVDTVAPAFSTTSLEGTLSCVAPWPNTTPTAEDACGGVTYMSTVDSVWLGGQWTLNITHVATDECLNAVSLVETLTVIDTTPPVFTFVAEDLTLSCTDNLPASEAVVEDACGGASWTSSELWTEGECPGSGVWTRTYVAIDEAGNQTEAVQMLTVIDTLPPTFILVPEATTQECGEPLVLDPAQAEDACSAVSLTWSLDSVPSATGPSAEVIVLWAATDACGNATTASQTVSLVDNTPPMWIHVPADTSLAMGEALPWAQWLAEAHAEDGCSAGEDLTVEFTWDTLASEGACTDTLEVVWTVTDVAGFSHSEVQRVTLTDGQAPQVVDWPVDVETPCDVAFTDSLPLASDVNDYSWTETFDTLTGPCPAEHIVRRTLQASDVCGNQTDPWIQFIFHVDTVPPHIVVPPEDLLFGDPNDVPPCAVDALVWEDACSETTLSCATDTAETYCPGSFLLLRTYTVEDACANSSSWVQSILVEDVEAPSVVSPLDDINVSCDAVVLPWTVDDISATDNATSGDDLVLEFLGEVEEGDNCGWTKTFSYRVTDLCGNQADTNYVVTWADTTSPEWGSVLEPWEVQCPAEVPNCEDLDVDATDACNDWTWDCVDAFEGGDCVGPDCVLIRSITLTDACGNATTADQTIVISEPPTTPNLPTGFSPNNDSFNDFYLIENVGPNLDNLPCDWLENTLLNVFDRWGSLVFTSTDVTVPWDGTNLQGQMLPTGTYFVVFDANGNTYHAAVELRR